MTDHVADGPIDTARARPRPTGWVEEPAAAPAEVTRDSGPLDLPDRRVFWGWVWQHVRPVVGWTLAALGALALFLGWFGVSGQALTAKQLPYLVSGGLVGIALIVMAGVFLATEDWRRQVQRMEILERKVDDLLALLTTDAPAELLAPVAGPNGGWSAGAGSSGVRSAGGGRSAPAGRVGFDDVIALPTGTVYHRPDCALIVGKPAAAPIDAASVADRGLAPCRVCDPPAPTV